MHFILENTLKLENYVKCGTNIHTYIYICTHKNTHTSGLPLLPNFPQIFLGNHKIPIFSDYIYISSYNVFYSYDGFLYNISLFMPSLISFDRGCQNLFENEPKKYIFLNFNS